MPTEPNELIDFIWLIKRENLNGDYLKPNEQNEFIRLIHRENYKNHKMNQKNSFGWYRKKIKILKIHLVNCFGLILIVN